jgi:hypothetical protein
MQKRTEGYTSVLFFSTKIALKIIEIADDTRRKKTLFKKAFGRGAEETFSQKSFLCNLFL